jgi:glycerol-3-phosphate dehydrogenase subunit B
MQALLRKCFTALGGTFFTGDQVINGIFDGDTLKAVTTAKLEGTTLEADSFILATGSFMSRGLVADYNHVYEPALGVDVDDLGLDRKTWAKSDVTQAQPYMEMGVTTDEQLRCLKNGKPIQNLRAIGSVLSGHDSVKMGDGTGVSLMTAIAAADHIRENK